MVVNSFRQPSSTWVTGCLLVCILSCSSLHGQPAAGVSKTENFSAIESSKDFIPTTSFEHPLKRGVNFGCMLEAPKEGDWGLTVKPEFFELAAQAGFDHVRLPVSWTHHTATESPFDIEPEFFQRVDWCLAEAERVGLKLILNVHHYDELNRDPIGEQERALAIWKQIAQRYKDRGEWLFFEILNEPHVTFNDRPELWNQFMRQALAIIREHHPRRPVLVGPVSWNSIHALLTTNFDPPQDPYLIVTVHYYEPFEFTHQGASWVDPSPALGPTWDGDRLNLHSQWQNWSWEIQIDSQTKEDRSGILITPKKGWAGLKMHHPNGIQRVKRLRVNIEQGKQLKIALFSGEKEKSKIVDFERDSGDFYLDWDDDFGAVTDVMIQSMSDDVIPPFLLRQLELEHAAGVDRILQSESDQIQLAFSTAATWAEQHKLRLHLGEFGAYHMADINPRAKWTRAVREQAEKHGIGWAYWEFAAGFGLFDPEANQWRQPLKEALLAE